MIRTMEQAYDAYNQMLDESGPVVIGGLDFYPSDILREMDQIAYDTGFNDYMDACDIDTDDLDEDSDFDDSMDGDFDSGMASAGYGTDEDYGYYGDNDD